MSLPVYKMDKGGVRVYEIAKALGTVSKDVREIIHAITPNDRTLSASSKVEPIFAAVLIDHITKNEGTWLA